MCRRLIVTAEEALLHDQADTVDLDLDLDWLEHLQTGGMTL